MPFVGTCARSKIFVNLMVGLCIASQTEPLTK
jgi:hypothetical protein